MRPYEALWGPRVLESWNWLEIVPYWGFGGWGFVVKLDKNTFGPECCGISVGQQKFSCSQDLFGSLCCGNNGQEDACFWGIHRRCCTDVLQFFVSVTHRLATCIKGAGLPNYRVCARFWHFPNGINADSKNGQGQTSICCLLIGQTSKPSSLHKQMQELSRIGHLGARPSFTNLTCQRMILHWVIMNTPYL